MTAIEKNLSEIILKMGLLVRGSVEEAAKQQAILEECKSACQALLDQNDAGRSHHEKVLAQFKVQVDIANGEAAKWKKLAAQAQKWQDQYVWVDEERIARENEIEDLKRIMNSNGDEPSEITDPDECPHCHMPHLIAVSSSNYECPACSLVFRLRTEP